MIVRLTKSIESKLGVYDHADLLVLTSGHETQFRIGVLYFICSPSLTLLFLHLILLTSCSCLHPPRREEAAAAIRDGEEQLQILKRQVVLGQLYPSSRSVME